MKSVSKLVKERAKFSKERAKFVRLWNGTYIIIGMVYFTMRIRPLNAPILLLFAIALRNAGKTRNSGFARGSSQTHQDQKELNVIRLINAIRPSSPYQT